MELKNINIRTILIEAIRENGIIVDVRTKEEFVSGHIPMAINIPLEDIKSGFVNIPINKYLIVYCENGGNSALAARILMEMGYEVANTVGGLKNYNGAITKNTQNI